MPQTHTDNFGADGKIGNQLIGSVLVCLVRGQEILEAGVLKGLIYEEVVEGEEATEQLGQKLASLLSPGDVIALYGELGAGKTCLVRGLAKGLGIENGLVVSPSFSLINEYPGPMPLFHIDCYRLHLDEEIQELGLEEFFDGPGITLIEWAERIKDLPVERWDISFTILDESRRRIQVKAYGKMVNRFKDWNSEDRIRNKNENSKSYSGRLLFLTYLFDNN